MTAGLIFCGIGCYGLVWLRHQLSGRVRLLPETRALWLLVLAALSYAAGQLVAP